MSISLLSILLIGFILGIKHSLEPDHVIAVATIVGKSKNILHSTLSGVCWGIGHTFTLFLVGMVFIFIKGDIPPIWAMSLEFIVGIMLVYLGLRSVLDFKKEVPKEKPNKNSYFISIFIGFIHGLAGSAAMILLTLSSVSSVLEGAQYILLFGLGTIVGMMFFSTIIGIPFTMSKNHFSLNRRFNQIAGSVSFLFGIYYIYNVGINEGLLSTLLQ